MTKETVGQYLVATVTTLVIAGGLAVYLTLRRGYFDLSIVNKSLAGSFSAKYILPRSFVKLAWSRYPMTTVKQLSPAAFWRLPTETTVKPAARCNQK